MYLPYLRGKQFELLALKEMASALGRHIVPIIEPVRRVAGSGLGRCVEALIESQVPFVLVVNPSVGDLAASLPSADLLAYAGTLPEDADWSMGVRLSEGVDSTEIVRGLRDCGFSDRSVSFVHRGLARDLDGLAAEVAGFPRSFDVIDERLRRRHFRDLIAQSGAVMLRDGFPAEIRNMDYVEKDESVFTEDHLYFEEEGWAGFSDFLTIGEAFALGGFTPRAVAIHWTYEPSAGSPIMIRHFTSDTNGDTANVGRKFLEAAGKLVDFLDERDIHTRAAEVMRQHVGSSTYPGLGIVKKLSIQNHLQLVAGILDRR